jgi:hypothetical protein
MTVSVLGDHRIYICGSPVRETAKGLSDLRKADPVSECVGKIAFPASQCFRRQANPFESTVYSRPLSWPGLNPAIQ